jgi:hypothetical protein
MNGAFFTWVKKLKDGHKRRSGGAKTTVLAAATRRNNWGEDNGPTSPGNTGSECHIGWVVRVGRYLTS